MNDSTLDTFIRHAATAVSRRRSFRLFGGAGLAGVFAAPTVAGAGKKGKKARCRRQVEACEAEVRAHCGEQQGCLDGFLPCCRFLATCQARAYVACTFLGE